MCPLGLFHLCELKNSRMLKSILKITFIMLTNTNLSNAQEMQYPLKKDITSIDGIIKASYEVVSGNMGEKRQWERDLSLHNSNAMYSFPTVDSKGTIKQTVMPINDFHKLTDDMVLETAFYENEINREVQIFGNIAHVWSTYETRLIKNGPVARRGINSIQLYFDEQRWWIISWVFDKESESQKIPATFDRH
jgi:hypothetical protein